jgi:Cu-Zn family superoxide dismutase
MKKLPVVALAAFLTVPAAAGAFAAATATAEFIDRNKNAIGKATLEQTPTGVLIDLELNGLPPGPHAIHVHGVGTCADAEAGFKASKGHVNPRGKKHGLRNPKGPDGGDLPNIFAAADGSVRAEMFTNRVTISGGDAALLDGDGSALVMHEKPDDHMAQPIGGAGARIACGVVRGM